MVNGIVEAINHKYGWHKVIDIATIKRMMVYPWPGNVRELENLIERLMVSTEGKTITVEDLPMEMLGSTVTVKEEGVDFKEILFKFEYDLIKNVIKRKGSIIEAAGEIGVDVTTVRRKLKRFEKMFSEDRGKIEVQKCTI